MLYLQQLSSQEFPVILGISCNFTGQDIVNITIKCCNMDKCPLSDFCKEKQNKWYFCCLIFYFLLKLKRKRSAQCTNNPSSLIIFNNNF